MWDTEGPLRVNTLKTHIILKSGVWVCTDPQLQDDRPRGGERGADVGLGSPCVQEVNGNLHCLHNRPRGHQMETRGHVLSLRRASHTGSSEAGNCMWGGGRPGRRKSPWGQNWKPRPLAPDGDTEEAGETETPTRLGASEPPAGHPPWRPLVGHVPPVGRPPTFREPLQPTPRRSQTGVRSRPPLASC